MLVLSDVTLPYPLVIVKFDRSDVNSQYSLGAVRYQ